MTGMTEAEVEEEEVGGGGEEGGGGDVVECGLRGSEVHSKGTEVKSRE
jgi:hypothetical protein